MFSWFGILFGLTVEGYRVTVSTLRACSANVSCRCRVCDKQQVAKFSTQYCLVSPVSKVLNDLIYSLKDPRLPCGRHLREEGIFPAISEGGGVLYRLNNFTSATE